MQMKKIKKCITYLIQKLENAYIETDQAEQNADVLIVYSPQKAKEYQANNIVLDQYLD